MKKWSKWWRENNVNLEREERRKVKEHIKSGEQEQKNKEIREEARKKYNKEVYK